MRMLLASILTVAGLSSAPAQAVTFEFIQSGTGDVLAEMDLSGAAPYSFTAIDAFRITSAGSALFGLATGALAAPFIQEDAGVLFSDQFEPDGGLSTGLPGSFNEVSTGFVELGVDDPLPTIREEDLFIVFFDTSVDAEDQLQLFVDGISVLTRVFASGDWERADAPVPVPAALLFLLSGVGALVMARRNRA